MAHRPQIDIPLPPAGLDPLCSFQSPCSLPAPEQRFIPLPSAGLAVSGAAGGVPGRRRVAVAAVSLGAGLPREQSRELLRLSDLSADRRRRQRRRHHPRPERLHPGIRLQELVVELEIGGRLVDCGYPEVEIWVD